MIRKEKKEKIKSNPEAVMNNEWTKSITKNQKKERKNRPTVIRSQRKIKINKIKTRVATAHQRPATIFQFVKKQNTLG